MESFATGDSPVAMLIDDPVGNAAPASATTGKRMTEEREVTEEPSLTQPLSEKSRKSGEDCATCSQCHFVFINKTLRDAHVLLTHSGNPTEQCSNCGAKFKTNLQLRKHMSIAYGLVTCVSCKGNRPIFDPSRFAVCSLCPGTFSSGKELKTHMLWAHQVNHALKGEKCEACKRALTNFTGTWIPSRVYPDSGSESANDGFFGLSRDFF